MENSKKILYDLHESSLAWINELEFINDEQVFLEHLLSTHFLELSTEKLYETTRKLIRKLKDSERMGTELTQEIHHHNKEIARVLENETKIEKKEVINSHLMIERDFETYLLKFKYVKKKIFGIIKEIMVLNKQKLLLNKT